ncbi:Na+/H+ antiporter NhaA [Paraflavitalea pollutisoli]|uniref:Na+/H+ antiporter NhaA n=1 Tax=Paraflavitalea pollutisoli TaxID=3034143 RepID=UPI0023EDA57D|nr:Na+/H+ antiporter NhaA [Paraflavitalea sp. H1-2-19X]
MATNTPRKWSVSSFIHQEFSGAIVLFACVVLAIGWANSPWSDSYHHFWETRFAVSFDDYRLDQPLHSWVNDGLMAIFFFLIGLELKREFMAGELSTAQKATLPAVAALGGMLVPGLIYFLINRGTPSEGGWGIPMATDIAFALALISLAGKHIPASLKVFLSALAVADDLGAVLVIAFFYTAKIALVPLLIGSGLLLVLAWGNRMGVRSLLFYGVIGMAIWICFLLSGIHATIAGVLVAFMIPARTRINEDEYMDSMLRLTEQFRHADRLNSPLITRDQLLLIAEAKQVNLDAETPLQKIEYALHPWVTFVIMPLFALCNAGIPIKADFFSQLANPVSVGVMAGLVIGKFTGVFLFTWIMVKLKLSSLPLGARWPQMAGVALLAGVGFTMSLFVTELAFEDSVLIDYSKYGILLASIVSGAFGLFVLKRSARRPG